VLESAQWTDTTCHEAGEVVARQANHMARLLDDLLDVARITRGRIVLRKENLDLRETTRSAIEALRPFMAEHQTQLTVDITDTRLPEPRQPVHPAARQPPCTVRHPGL
jgi:signal transduction histidine kinase